MTKDLPRRPKCCIISVTSIGEASCVPMKRQLLAAALVLILIVYPSLGITEDVETVMLAKTLYTLCRDESYDTMLAMGTVVMNRVESILSSSCVSPPPPFHPRNAWLCCCTRRSASGKRRRSPTRWRSEVGVGRWREAQASTRVSPWHRCGSSRRRRRKRWRSWR